MTPNIESVGVGGFRRGARLSARKSRLADGGRPYQGRALAVFTLARYAANTASGRTRALQSCSALGARHPRRRGSDMRRIRAFEPARLARKSSFCEGKLIG